jgi:hypothetical protein
MMTLLYDSLRRDKNNVPSGLYRQTNNSALTVSVSEMMLSGVRMSCSLIAQSQQQVLRNVSALVIKSCNSTAAITQARSEEWDYAKPFEDIPGPKPLPIIGNTWRFIPYLGNVNYTGQQISTTFLSHELQ